MSFQNQFASCHFLSPGPASALFFRSQLLFSEPVRLSPRRGLPYLTLSWACPVWCPCLVSTPALKSVSALGDSIPFYRISLPTNCYTEPNIQPISTHCSKACNAAFTASICFVMAPFSDCRVSMRDSCSSMSRWRCVSSWSAVFRCSWALAVGATSDAGAGALAFGDVVVGSAVAAWDLPG